MNNDPPKLGQIINGPAKRDAIHVAIAPIEAGEDLMAGVRVKVHEGKAFREHAVLAVGIVDPFLTGLVRKGQKFYLCLFPNTVTSLRHEWTHPSFEEDEPITGPNKESIEWLTAYAENFNMDYAELIEAMHDANRGHIFCLDFDTPGEAYGQDKETAWEHYELVTGDKVTDKCEQVFRCAC